MRFPLISDIASTSVTAVSISSNIADALEIMLENNHRNIVVIDSDCFRVLTVLDVLQIRNNDVNIESKLSDLNLSIIPTIHRDENVLSTVEYLNDEMEYICVVNTNGTLYGLVTHTDITSNIDPDTLMDNYRLTDFLKQSRRMKWISKEMKTSLLLQEMLDDSFDNVIVVDKMKPIGILTTKDIVGLIKHKKDLELPVSTYMSSPVDSIHENSSIKVALEFVKNKHYKRVVVVDNKGDLSGIIAQKELISLTYSRWSILMKEYQEELSEINHILETKNKEYETLASTDSLTGLYNRYKFSELYLSSYTTMVQRGNALSLVLVDIDFFKVVNDTYGHNVGDEVLRKISKTLIKVLRDIDIVCRWGGEEFVILLPTASLDNAVILANKIRIHIQEIQIEYVGSITASFGVTQIKEGDTMDSSIDRADKALYLAKGSGRNCAKTDLDT